jgi:hypothetical protein
MLIDIVPYETKTLRGLPRRVFVILSKEVIKKPQIAGLFKNAQMQGAQKESREAYIYIR